MATTQPSSKYMLSGALGQPRMNAKLVSTAVVSLGFHARNGLGQLGFLGPSRVYKHVSVKHRSMCSRRVCTCVHVSGCSRLRLRSCFLDTELAAVSDIFQLGTRARSFRVSTPIRVQYVEYGPRALNKTPVVCISYWYLFAVAILPRWFTASVSSFFINTGTC